MTRLTKRLPSGEAACNADKCIANCARCEVRLQQREALARAEETDLAQVYAAAHRTHDRFCVNHACGKCPAATHCKEPGRCYTELARIVLAWARENPEVKA